ncbi:DNA-binding transcriptional regulator, MarR family [Gracilibacillus orientalis]|uniref:DNA-binding transcriptional regulator, MarR family n=1 Tax=Gracilibacillus orientalis TaxID=334253 RepID=A0A1I4GYG1_9BACI|nr:MarR family transcriptional regulator [Gracilibacillus orientalis]SFL34397.1 DNA-binding transcriptional regulator, MarR family [Gracilibacillus orientalis]
MDTSHLLHLYNQKLRLFQNELNITLKKFGLFHSQWTILYTLYQKGKMTQTEIWQYLKVEAPTITRTLVRLEKNGWIERKVGTDKRERVVTLTEKAESTYLDIIEAVKQTEEMFLNQLSKQEKIALQQLLEKLSIERDE